MKQFLLDSLPSMDEAYFHLGGNINSQNSRVLSTENPLRLSKICVCRAVYRK